MATKMEALKEKATLALKRAKGLADFLTGPKDVVAIDIGSYSIKIVEFKQEAGSFQLKNWGQIELKPKPEASPEEKKIYTINELKAFFIKKGIRIKESSTAVSGNSVIVRYVKFPRLTKGELTATLATEAEPFIPFDINEVQLGFHILDEIMEDGQKKMEVVLVAAKKDLIANRLDILQGAGLTPTIIDIDPFALENVHERVREPKLEAGATLYLNIGHMVTNLSIIENGVTRVVRDIFIAGNSLTKAVMKAFQLDQAAAEQAKFSYGIIVDPAEKEKALAEGQREALGVSQALTTVVKDLVSEVHRSVDFYLSQGPERSIGRMVLMGGSARLKNLSKHLSAELKVPVAVLNPFSFLKKAELPAELGPEYAVAVGLGLRRNGDWE